MPPSTRRSAERPCRRRRPVAPGCHRMGRPYRPVPHHEAPVTAPRASCSFQGQATPNRAAASNASSNRGTLAAGHSAGPRSLTSPSLWRYALWSRVPPCLSRTGLDGYHPVTRAGTDAATRRHPATALDWRSGDTATQKGCSKRKTLSPRHSPATLPGCLPPANSDGAWPSVRLQREWREPEADQP